MKVSDFEKAQKLRNNGEINTAVKLYLKVRKENPENKKLVSESLHMIGVAYYQIEKFDTAKKYLLDSLHEFKEEKNLESMGYVLRDLGSNARGQKKLDEAEKYFQESIENLSKTGNKGHEGMTKVRLGRVFADQNIFEKAINEINQGIKLIKRSEEQFFLSSAYLDRAKVYLQFDQKKKALLDLDDSLRILNKISGPHEFILRRKDISELIQKLNNNSNPILVVCGPTATGKTDLAFQLSKKINGELISADSRMVYKYMDIGTGKDIKKYGTVLGYDLVSPKGEFNISSYSTFARKTIQDIYQRKHIPIVVGGSGLYIKSITDNIHTINISANKILRENLKDKTVEELTKILKNSDNKKLQSMNNSDKNNPRRLIRAIEIAASTQTELKNNSSYDVLFIGLTVDKKSLKKRIDTRVDERVSEGFEKEIEFLKKNKYWSGAPSRTLGYKDWPDINKWKNEEFKYAKRQMTWFKKDLRINWFDIGKRNFEKDVEKLVQKWYSQVKYASKD